MTMTGQASVTNHVLVTLLEARCNCNVNSTGYYLVIHGKLFVSWLVMILLYFHKFFFSLFFLILHKKGQKLDEIAIIWTLLLVILWSLENCFMESGDNLVNSSWLNHITGLKTSSLWVTFTPIPGLHSFSMILGVKSLMKSPQCELYS